MEKDIREEERLNDGRLLDVIGWFLQAETYKKSHTGKNKCV